MRNINGEPIHVFPIVVKDHYQSHLYPEDRFFTTQIGKYTFETELHNMVIIFSVKNDDHYEYESTMFLIAWALNR